MSEPALPDDAMPSPEWRTFDRAIDRGYFANKGVIALLDTSRMPLTASVEAGMAYYAGDDGAPGPDFRLWLWARSMALIVDAYDALRGVKPVTPPPAEIEQPDEALGLAVELTAEDGAQQQQRLTGA